MVVATHIVKVRGTFDKNIWNDDKLRKYVRKKIICEIDDSFHTHLELFKIDDDNDNKGKIEVLVYIYALPSEIDRDTSVESMEDAMTGVWKYHLHYCQKCGCSFKMLGEYIKKGILDNIEKNLYKIEKKLDISKILENLKEFNKVWENDEKVRCPNCGSIDIFPKYVSEDEIIFQCHECISRFSVTNNGKFEIINKCI